MLDEKSKPIEIATLIITILKIIFIGIGGYLLVGKQQSVNVPLSGKFELNSI